MAKWAVKLSEYDITYRPRSAMKAQVLADFIIECTWGDSGKEIQPSDEMEMTDASWILHMDGASNSSGCGAGLILSDPNRDITEYAL